MRKFKALLAASVLTLLEFAGCSTEVSGGVSEETNTVAGVLRDFDGKTLPGVAVLALHTEVDSLAFADTTDGEGRFAFPIQRQGVYGISANQDSLAAYSVIEYRGEKLEMEIGLNKTTAFEGRVTLDAGEDLSNVEVALPGSPWSVETDSAGVFRFENIPAGTYTIVVKSPDLARYADGMYLVEADVDSACLFGPFYGSSIMGAVQETSKAGDVPDRVVQLPHSPEYGLVSWWSMDNLSGAGSERTLRDAAGQSDPILLYGDAQLVEGISGKALSLKGIEQFGVVEKDNGALAGADQFTLELFLEVDSLALDSGARKNIIGKIGFGSEEDRNVFSLALTEDDCGETGARLAFFLSDGSGDSLSCSNAVVSSRPMEFGSWMHVVIVFEESTLKLYKNGALDSQRSTSIKKIQESDESIFFGKERLNLKLDEVRLSKTAINGADVLYRYNLKGGAL